MDFQISASLLVMRVHLNAPPKFIQGFINLPHLIVNLSQSNMSFHAFIFVYFVVSFQAFDRFFKVSLVFVSASQTIECLQIIFIVLETLRKTEYRLLFSVQSNVKFPSTCDHTIIFWIFLQILKVIFKSLFFLDLTKVSGQPFICLAEVWININHFSQAIDGSFAISSFECFQIATIAFEIELSIKETCCLPQSSNMSGIQLDNIQVVIPTSF